MEATSVVRSVVLAANQYSRNQSDANLVHLQSQLDVLIGITSRDKSLGYFSPRQLLPSECLTCLVDLLNDPVTPLDLSLKTMVLLFNLAADCDVRETLQLTFNLPASLAAFLKVQRGSTNGTVAGQCIQLLQRVTYNYRIIYPNNYVEDLVQFLLLQILGSETELTMPCLGLLANLCRQNVSVQAHIKGMDNLKSISKTLIRFLSHSSLTNIIFSLSILTSLCLNEELGDKLFNARNISQTFQLIFNIMINGDGVVTRRYAVDLFIDLLKSPRIQQSLLTFEHFQLCLHKVLGLLPTQDDESVSKIFELVLSFCGVTGLRPTVCRGIMASPQVQQGGQGGTPSSEPFFAVVQWASRPIQSNNTVSLLALDVLREVYEEMLDSGLTTQLSPRTDVSVPMAIRLIPPLQELEGAFIKHKLTKITKVMNLLMTLCNDDGLRSELSQVMTFDPSLLIVEHQLDNNQVGISRSRMAAGDCEWSDAGVGSILHIVDLMVTLQPNMPQLKTTLCQLLQDQRMVPFLAHGLSSDQRERVQVSLKLIRAAATLPDFPTIILGECIASNNSHRGDSSQQSLSMDPAATLSHHNPNQSFSNNGYDRTGLGPNLEVTRSKVKGSDNAGLDKLIDRMNTGLDLKDVKASEIMDVYEHKLSTLATKESHLQDLLEAKAMALAQADRLIAQYRCRKAQADNEARKLRSMIQESEKRSEEYRDQLGAATVERERMLGEMKNMKGQIERLEVVAREHERLTVAHAELGQRLEGVKETLQAEKQERANLLELHEMLTKHSEALKHKHEVTLSRLEEVEGQQKGTAKQLRQTEGRLGEVQGALKDTEAAVRKTERERDELEAAIDKLRAELGKAEQAKKKLSHQVSNLESECRQQKSAIREKDALIGQQKEELSKQNQLTLMIHSLTGNPKPEK